MKLLNLSATVILGAISVSVFADASDFTRVMEGYRKAGQIQATCKRLGSSTRDFRSEFRHLILPSTSVDFAAGNGCAINGTANHGVSVSHNLFNDRETSELIFVGEMASFSIVR